jgi:hypothetical protein
LSLAAPFGHRFGEVGEKHGEPEPQCHLHSKEQVLGMSLDDVADNEQRR